MSKFEIGSKIQTFTNLLSVSAWYHWLSSGFGAFQYSVPYGSRKNAVETRLAPFTYLPVVVRFVHQQSSLQIGQQGDSRDSADMKPIATCLLHLY